MKPSRNGFLFILFDNVRIGVLLCGGIASVGFFGAVILSLFVPENPIYDELFHREPRVPFASVTMETMQQPLLTGLALLLAIFLTPQLETISLLVRFYGCRLKEGYPNALKFLAQQILKRPNLSSVGKKITLDIVQEALILLPTDEALNEMSTNLRKAEGL